MATIVLVEPIELLHQLLVNQVRPLGHQGPLAAKFLRKLLISVVKGAGDDVEKKNVLRQFDGFYRYC